MKKTTKLEAILWSVAFPGFGQLLNGHLIKGIMFIFLEYPSPKPTMERQ
jgi:TM2 domain-containing membrane protein YozV